MSRLRSMTAIAGVIAVMGCASVVPERPSGPFVVPSQTVRHGMNADAHYGTGRYFQGQVRFEQAIEAYHRVLAAQPAHVDALNALGVIHSLQQQPELAERYFRLALDADPLAARVHNNLGYHLLKSGHGAEAIVAFEKAQELDPGNADTQANLLAAHVAMGRSGEANMGAAPVAPVEPAAPAETAATTATTATMTTVASTALTAQTVPVSLDRVADGVWALGTARAPAAASVGPMAPATAARSTATMGAAPAMGRVEVSNANGATGLARWIAGILAPASALRARLTNDKPYGVKISRIQYVGGSEQLAQEINARLPAPLPMARIEFLDRDVRVRVLLGKDFPSQPFEAQLSTWRNS